MARGVRKKRKTVSEGNGRDREETDSDLGSVFEFKGAWMDRMNRQESIIAELQKILGGGERGGGKAEERESK